MARHPARRPRPHRRRLDGAAPCLTPRRRARSSPVCARSSWRSVSASPSIGPALPEFARVAGIDVSSVGVLYSALFAGFLALADDGDLSCSSGRARASAILAALGVLRVRARWDWRRRDRPGARCCRPAPCSAWATASGPSASTSSRRACCTHRPAFVVNLINVLYGVGTVVGPLMTSALLRAGGPARWVPAVGRRGRARDAAVGVARAAARRAGSRCARASPSSSGRASARRARPDWRAGLPVRRRRVGLQRLGADLPRTHPRPDARECRAVDVDLLAVVSDRPHRVDGAGAAHRPRRRARGIADRPDDRRRSCWRSASDTRGARRSRWSCSAARPGPSTRRCSAS